jgi:hypothetical protein
LSTSGKSGVATARRDEKPHPCKGRRHPEWLEMSGDVMSRTMIQRRDEAGATTAEYAVCTGAGVGFAGLLFKFLTSETGQTIVKTVFDHVLKLLPF